MRKLKEMFGELPEGIDLEAVVPEKLAKVELSPEQKKRLLNESNRVKQILRLKYFCRLCGKRMGVLAILDYMATYICTHCRTQETVFLTDKDKP